MTCLVQESFEEIITTQFADQMVKFTSMVNGDGCFKDSVRAVGTCKVCLYIISFTIVDHELQLGNNVLRSTTLFRVYVSGFIPLHER